MAKMRGSRRVRCVCVRNRRDYEIKEGQRKETGDGPCAGDLNFKFTEL